MILTEFLVALSLTVSPCDTIVPPPDVNLNEFIIQNTQINDKGERVTTDAILLPQSSSEITGKRIVIPKGAIMTDGADLKLKPYTQPSEKPKKKKRAKK
jgi:hypothetical protein